MIISHPSLLLGEWLFAHHLFGDQLPDPQRDAGDVLKQYLTAHSSNINAEFITQLPRLRDLTGPYLEVCMATIPWEQYAVVGFTTTFHQNTASLALAQRIKESWSNKIIVFGGANYGDGMGVELHRQFSFVDYVCSGESDYL